MGLAAIRELDAAALRRAGRAPATPFRVRLAGGDELLITALLRVLPGKRIVGAAQWRGERVLAKLFIATGGFVGDRALRHFANEKSGIEQLQHACLPTPELRLAAPLALGGHVLLTRFLDDAQSLAERWLQVAGLPAGHADALTELQAAFAMLGRLHGAGLVQSDLHLGNFMLAEGRCWVIDGDAVQAISPGQPLNESVAAGNLALLLAQLPADWDDHREALLAPYFAAGANPINDLAVLERELARARNWRLADFLKKTVRDCSLFAVKRSVSRFVAVRREEAAALVPLLATAKGLDRAIAGGKLLKDGRTSTVAEVFVGNRQLVIKRYNLKNIAHAFGRCWRPSRAWHSWREGHRLAFLGIATPALLALVEERIGPMRRRAFLVNEHCPGIDLLTLLSPDHVPDDAVAKAILGLFACLHQLQISHGDLKATNLLWHDGRVVVIDLDALRQHDSSTAYARAWRRDRARLLRNWPVSSPLYDWLAANLPGSDAKD